MNTSKLFTTLLLCFISVSFFNYEEKVNTEIIKETPENIAHKQADDTPEYFLLRPEVEKAYGYSHAVKIGNSIKISGAVSMDDEGNPTAVGDLAQQMKNCYADLEKILKHYGCTFDDVVKEDVFTTDMSKFLEAAAYRTEIYKTQFPTGSWLGVTELAVPEFMIEIELEVHKTK
ncbi:RidA family protein [Winogradskyella thalassocola]|uniref:Enamine deaminase RidA, house cleaning of reactive enamine intermediates, YjgF/YER057c/UK114 family n=1 Tax=Winogradskyella thalassocola TaxID=262004 RepID=A0A1G7Z9F0_9FLAO|nr:RidA family protein [Winogradskyella thalassocola]SDH04740.1 Enamine deaminase RidA, house cleaning of reactive enamine intermediates, YjgF/YER057c/UK114 family [Winogradskyella thalassocola]